MTACAAHALPAQSAESMSLFLRAVGDWDIFTDLGHGRREFVYRPTGEARREPPAEVAKALIAEESALQLPTPHRLQALGSHVSAVEAEASGASLPSLWEARMMRRHDFCHGGGISFVLRDFLTEGEAADVVQQAEAIGFKPCPESKQIRVTDRVMAAGGDLSDLLFARARPHLQDFLIGANGTVNIDGQWLPAAQVGLPDDLLEGKWVPVKLNPLFRICRYKPGGFFLPHFDYAYDESIHCRGFKTFMMYLNDVVEGGPTNFYNNKQGHYKRPKTANVIDTFQPERGSCMIFNQQLLHDGGELRAGLKYLLRTEVMYQFEGPAR